jgi:SAM-dependent methyltransferase
MSKSENLKKVVKDKYAAIVSQDEGCGCGCSCSTGDETGHSVFSERYESQKGYVKEADLGLGCGLPTEYADIKPGDNVLDLGSGAGNDCFVARSFVGDAGKVTGLDFTDEMVTKAEVNNLKMGYTNVEFVKGDIEEMPFADNTYDVVISNCVINLVPDKEKAFSEIIRVLKPGGHFCISDVVLKGALPPELQSAAELYAGCVAGALEINDYLGIINKTGFEEVRIRKNKPIELPDSVLLESISSDELILYKNSGSGIFSITLVGKKPV